MPEKRRKHVPLRTCIACRQTRPKRELIRIVRTPEGTVVIDPGGKRPGRGAYLCVNRQCWEVALEQRRLFRALRCQLTADDEAALRESVASLWVEEAAAEPGNVMSEDWEGE